MAITAYYIAGMAIIYIAFPLSKSVPAWSTLPIAKVDVDAMYSSHGTMVSAGGDASSFFVIADSDGTIKLLTHEAVTKSEWYYGTYIAPCVKERQ